jgi:hypothetical protein
MKYLAIIVLLFGVVGYVSAMEVSEAMTYQGSDFFFERIGKPHPIDPPKCEPVPIPAAVWLFASALAGIGVISKRKA